jgi:hypothetical protein
LARSEAYKLNDNRDRLMTNNLMKEIMV